MLSPSPAETNEERHMPHVATRASQASRPAPTDFDDKVERTLVLHSPRTPHREPASEVVGRALNKRALFRASAIDAYLASTRDDEVLRVAPPWARHVLAIAGLAVVALFLTTFFVDVDQTGRGRGALRVAGGAQTVTAQTTGTVLEVAVRSGDVAAESALLVKIDSTATKTALLAADREIARAEEDIAVFEARRDKEQAARIGLLRQRAALLGKRAESQRTSNVKLAERLKTFDRLAREGLASSLDRGSAEADLATSQRGAIALEEEISAVNLQAASIAAELSAELDRKRAELQRTRDRRDALAFQLEQTEVRAPKAGRLEAVVVKVGDSITTGAPIARVIPAGAPRQVVVFLPEPDRAFLSVGSEVRVELDQLPVGEFGSLRAVVARIGADLATAAEIADAIGDGKVDGPSYRVELDLRGDQIGERLDHLLLSGSLVTARFVLRKRRLATLLFEPLKRFLEG